MVCLVFICLLVFIQIVFREVFNIGLQWVFEISCFLQVTMVWLGVPILLYRKTNIRISALYNVCPLILKKLLNIVYYLIYIACFLFMSLGYHNYVKSLGIMQSPVVRIPNYIFFGSFFFGITMSILVLIIRARDIISVPQSVSEKNEVM